MVDERCGWKMDPPWDWLPQCRLTTPGGGLCAYHADGGTSPAEEWELRLAHRRGEVRKEWDDERGTHTWWMEEKQ